MEQPTESTKEGIRKEIQHAYADTEASPFDPSRRCLSFVTSEFVGIETAKELAGEVPEYNLFDPENLRNVLDVIQGADVQARVAFAREGSVCLYIEVAPHANDRVWRIFRNMTHGPDEVTTRQYDDIGSRDILGNGIHNRCDHDDDDPPVPEGREATARSGTDVVRVWWD